MEDRKRKKLLNFRNSRMKISLGFSIAILLVFGLGVYDYLVIHIAKDKVKAIADKEVPFLIAEKGLVLAVEDSIAAVRGYISSGGDENYREQFNKHAAIISYNMDTVKKLGASEELNVLLEKNIEWLEFAEAEVLDEYDRGDRAAAFQNLENSHTHMNEIVVGYQELIVSKEGSIKELEQEVLASEKTSKIVLNCMTLLIGVMSISAVTIIIRKILTRKDSKVFSEVVA